MARVVFTTFGSYGDLHPYLAIALHLKKLGVPTAIASCPNYAPKVASLDLPFIPIRPNEPDWIHEPELAKALLHERTSVETLFRHFVLRHLRESFADLNSQVQPGDLLISHPLTLMTRLVAQSRGLRWLSTALQPMGFMSRYDPPVLAAAPLINRIGQLGPRGFAFALQLLRCVTNSWIKPYTEFRRELGLAPERDPLISGQYSPLGTLALFSKAFATPQRDWPTRTIITGFPWLEEPVSINPELQTFVEEGSAPLIFTLGSAAIHDARNFYEESATLCIKLRRRGVLLVGKQYATQRQSPDPSLLITDYAPFSYVFAKAAAIVHSGGIGTLAQCLAHGKPQLVVPFANDQPDNARRITRLGCGLTMNRFLYRTATAQPLLERLLTDVGYEERARQLQRALSAEDGLAAAGQAILNVMQKGDIHATR